MPESVELRGPILTGDAPALVLQTVKERLADVTKRGQEFVTAQMTDGHGVKSGAARGAVRGTVVDELHGRIDMAGIVYNTWLESGPHGRQPQGRFHGYHLFKTAYQKLISSGLAEPIAAAIVEKIG